MCREVDTGPQSRLSRVATKSIRTPPKPVSMIQLFVLQGRAQAQEDTRQSVSLYIQLFVLQERPPAQQDAKQSALDVSAYANSNILRKPC